MKILAAKQVGVIYYYTDNIYSLINIVKQQMIYPSTDMRNKRAEYYTSFTRDATIQPRRKSYKWKYGLIIDGNKLSNRYSINPVSDAYSRLVKGSMKVAYVTLYSDNSAKMCIAGRGTFEIPSDLYHMIKHEMINMSEDEKTKLGFYMDGRSTRPQLGRYREERVGFRAKHGGLRLSIKLSQSIINNILKSDAFNEREERIKLSSLKSVDISKCILGVYLPENFVKSDDTRDKDALEELKQVLKDVTNNIDIKIYK